MHDYRFKQMEYTLPDEYLEETELDRQRKIHDSLITMGLELISESYLEPMKAVCDDAGLEFEPKMMDGKHHVEIVRDIRESGYDLTVLGVMGIGRVRDTQIGSVCERVARTADKDVLVVKRLPAKAHPANGNGNGNHAEADGRDTILVGVDGSPQSFGALMTAIDLAKTFGKKVEAISVYDPYLHYSVFKGVVNVLTEARREDLPLRGAEPAPRGDHRHRSRADLPVAPRRRRDDGDRGRRRTDEDPSRRQGLPEGPRSRPEDRPLDAGHRPGRRPQRRERDRPRQQRRENLLRSCPCDILLTTRLEHPELDVKAEESIRWTPEAEERFERVPEQVRGIARTALYRLAVEQGHSVISSDVLDEAMDRYMPKYTARETEALAEKVALQLARSRPTFICRKCGVTSAEPDPVRCGVCGSESFEQITEEMLDRIAEMEGGLEVETTYDGRKLKWTADARLALKTIEDLYRRRRAKARIEKKARMSKLPTVTFEFARVMIEDETGEPVTIEAREEAAGANGNGAGAAEQPSDERKLIARDEDRVPLLSNHDWSAEAIERILRVPAGFMRDRTQERIELVAREKHVPEIGIKTVEEGIALGRELMEQMIAAYEIGKGDGADAAAVAEAETKAAEGAGRCPFSALAEAGASEAQVEAAKDAKAGTYLNEVGLMSALDEKRKAGEPEA